jgi:formate-dependent nitrite reductase membrane component NrfD
VNYWKKEFKPLAKTAAIVAPLSFAVGMLFLLIDLGQPLRAWRLFLNFNPTSAISWGTWFLNIFFVFSLVYAWLLIKGEDEKAKKLAYAGLPFAFLVATYTGMLLHQAPGRILWHNAMLPWLFLLGGLISSIALVILLSAGRQNRTILVKLARFVVWLVLLELVMVFLEIITLFTGGTETVTTVKALLSGSYGLLFWGVQIFVGAAIPVFILLRNKTSGPAQAIACMLILMGIYAMRYIVVVGGQIIQ